MTPQTLTVAASAISASKIYGSGEDAVYALNDVSVDFYEGQFTAIMGPSGSGKSTLMHCIAGLDELTKGSAIIDGVDLSTMKDKGLTELRREKIGFVLDSKRHQYSALARSSHSPTKRTIGRTTTTCCCSSRTCVKAAHYFC
jgi:putative ABC transport system ATP-binding protein